MSNIQGVDISNAGQGNSVDWAAVKAAGTAFAYIKASQGTYFNDPSFGRNVLEAETNGIVWGAYLYWDPTVDAKAQVQRFSALYGRWAPGELPPMLDVEKDGWANDGSHLTPAQLIQHVTTCLLEMERMCGKRPGVYTYPDFWRTRMGNTNAFAAYPLWLAAYPHLPSPLIGGWQSVAIHQYSDSGWIGSMKVDQDLFIGTDEMFRQFIGAPPPSPSPSPDYTPPGAKFSLIGGFKDFYLAEPKAAQYFGLPITGEIAEKLDDGNTYTVQYFERARFEWHQELPGKPVLLGLVGREAAKARGISV